MHLKKPETTTANFSSHLKGLGGCQVVAVGQKDSGERKWDFVTHSAIEKAPLFCDTFSYWTTFCSTILFHLPLKEDNNILVFFEDNSVFFLILFLRETLNTWILFCFSFREVATHGILYLQVFFSYFIWEVNTNGGVVIAVAGAVTLLSFEKPSSS